MISAALPLCSTFKTSSSSSIHQNSHCPPHQSPQAPSSSFFDGPDDDFIALVPTFFGLLVCCVSRVLIAGRHFDPKQRCLHHPERQQEVRSIAHKRLHLHTHMYMHLHLHLLIACSINDSVMELLIMISACEGGSAKSVTGTRISYRSLSHHPLTVPVQSCHAVFPLLAPVEEEAAPRSYHSSHGSEPPPYLRRRSRNHRRPPCVTDAGLLQVPRRQPRGRAPPCSLGAHARAGMERSSRSQQEPWRN